MPHYSERLKDKLMNDLMKDGITPVPASELIGAALARPVPLLDPLLTDKTLALLHGPRGLGKTFVALGIAWAVAGGGSFLGWSAPEPRDVLYVDGEMSAIDMQERLRLFGSAPAKLGLLMADLARDYLPDLGFTTGQAWLMHAAKRTGRRPALLVLDNLASLTGFHTNDPDRWTEMQRFLLSRRRDGMAVLAVHHTNKQGLQRGTSRREDVLDLVLGLRRPADYEPGHGARFEIHFDKARSLRGGDVDAIEAKLVTDTLGVARWEWRPASGGEFERAVALLRDGLKPNQIARELGISRTKSYRLRERAMEKGLVER